MKKATKRNLIVVGLLALVTGLTLGFAAFSNTLTIKSSATVTPQSNNFSVKFSSSSTELKTDEIEPELCSGTGNFPCEEDFDGGITATNAVINNDGNPTLSGIQVNFTTPEQWTEYYFFIRNDGEYDAYLNEVKFNNVSGKNSNIVCTADDGTSQSLVDEACNDVSIGMNYDYTGDNEQYFSESKLLSNILLKKGDSIWVLVVVRYLNEENPVIADGPFTVEFGDIELVFSTVNEAE